MTAKAHELRSGATRTAGVRGGAAQVEVPEECSTTAPLGSVSCARCGKANHPTVHECVFCGAAVARAQTLAGVRSQGPAGTVRMSHWSESADSHAAPSSRRAADSDFDALTTATPDPLIGVIIADRYRIIEGIGRGGMGVVYKVEHRSIGKLLAMKLLTGELSRNPEVVRRFKQEALTASKLSSPNTVQVFDYGISDGLTYLVMELVTGEDLGRALRTFGPMPFARLGKIIIQVCSSLAEAHQKGIVHRDMKPENIMLMRARDGTDLAKVLDFGLAKLREGADLNDVTSQGAIVGTPYYMSPEQVRGDAVDARSDIYAVGALMYRALTGHYAFNGPTPMAVFTKHLTEDAVPPTERAPDLDIPRAVSAIVMKALAKNPSDRYQKIEDLQTALIAEARSGGTTSVEDLLDTSTMRRLERAVKKTAQASVAIGLSAVATRDEVERYERKLRRQRYGAVGFLAALILAVAGVGAHVAFARQTAFRGVEIEPNDSPAEALAVPLGKRVQGYIGKRIDATHSDRDFYAIDVAGSSSGDTTARLRVTALPNFATCTLLYRQGLATPLAQYCVGRPGRDLVVDALRLEPGRYLLAVMQDMDPYGASAAPFVYENVSDPYSLLVEQVEPDATEEIEPNDQIASANAIAAGTSIHGSLAWVRDEDVFCVSSETRGDVRWRATDGVRDVGVVLEATPVRGPDEGAPVRIHSYRGAPSATDVTSPWISDPIPDEPDVARCLRLRLVSDPWAGASSSVVPMGSNVPYEIEVEAL